MKIFPKIIGIIIIISIGFAVYPPVKTLSLQKETMKVAIADITAISDSWNIKELEKRANPRLLQDEKQRQEWEGYFKTYQALGKLKTPVGCNSFNYEYHSSSTSNYTEVNYNCVAMYDNGNAEIFIQLLQNNPNDPWQILALRITPFVFANTLKHT